MKHRRSHAGTTLLELMIVLVLFSVLMYCVFLFVDRGITMYRESVDALEIRQEALVGLSRVSDEVRDSAQASVHCETGAVPGIVFSSTKRADGTTAVEPNSGRPYWQKYVCYYLDQLPDGTPCIHRKEQAIDPIASGPHAGKQPFEIIPDPYGETIPRTPQYFHDDIALPKRLITRQVNTFFAEKVADLVEIRLEFNVSRRYTHLIEVRTKVFPRS